MVDTFDGQIRGGVGMPEDGNVVGYFFGVIGLLVMAVGPAFPIAAVHKARLRARTLAHGLTAEARCLETYVAEGRVGTDPSDRRTRSVRHVILGFRIPDGRDIRFRDTSGVPRVMGDHVPVRHLPDQPHRAVAADRAPSGTAAGIAASVFVGLFVAGIGPVFAVMGFGTASGGMGGDTSPSAKALTSASGSSSTTACTRSHHAPHRYAAITISMTQGAVYIAQQPADAQFRLK